MVIADISGLKVSQPYQTSLDHIRAELQVMALKINFRVRQLRQPGGTAEAAGLPGLYISEKEIDDILTNTETDWSLPHRQSKNISAGPEVIKIKQLEEEIRVNRLDAHRRGLWLRWDSLRNLYKLSGIESDTLLVCLLAELDARYQKLFAYWRDDISQKAPSVDLVLKLLCESPEEAWRARQCFITPSPLVKYSLITLGEARTANTPDWTPGWTTRSIGLDEGITGFLTGRDRLDSRLTLWTTLTQPANTLAEAAIAAETRTRLTDLISQYKDQSLIFSLSSGTGQPRQAIAGAICSALQTRMLALNARNIIQSGPSAGSFIPLIFREASLYNAVIFLDDFDYCLEAQREPAPAFQQLIQEMNSFGNWIIVGLEKEWQPERMIAGKPCSGLRLSDLVYRERLQIWEKQLQEIGRLEAGIDIATLAAKFKFNRGQIEMAAQTARNLARWRNPKNSLVNNDDLHDACRRQSGITLETLARKIQPHYGWGDIILPVDQKEQLYEICSYLEHYPAVYEGWGFGRKLSLGKGLKALFAGPPGTGKTMAAEVMANELKIDVYKIDLSTIVSKYIGETEKNLDKIFYEGQTSNAILFFDEADALFGKRSEVRDAHDRYANIETAYLLQKMDEYEGAVILATNLRKNMDEAFARRLHFVIEFPLPDEADRQRIWSIVFPPEAPLADDIDLPFLSRLKISGGNIKNIALLAAFLAVREGTAIKMEHLVRAARREFQKIGRLCTEEDFAQYYKLVKL